MASLRAFLFRLVCKWTGVRAGGPRYRALGHVPLSSCLLGTEPPQHHPKACTGEVAHGAMSGHHKARPQRLYPPWSLCSVPHRVLQP